MTKITFYKSGGFYYGFEENGHTGYGESGEDILCSALSSMTMLIINAIEVSYASDVQYTIDEKTTDIKLICKSALHTFALRASDTDSLLLTSLRIFALYRDSTVARSNPHCSLFKQ